jgi:hypothetical protein
MRCEPGIGLTARRAGQQRDRRPRRVFLDLAPRAAGSTPDRAQLQFRSWQCGQLNRMSCPAASPCRHKNRVAIEHAFGRVHPCVRAQDICHPRRYRHRLDDDRDAENSNPSGQAGGYRQQAGHRGLFRAPLDLADQLFGSNGFATSRCMVRLVRQAGSQQLYLPPRMETRRSSDAIQHDDDSRASPGHDANCDSSSYHVADANQQQAAPQVPEPNPSRRTVRPAGYGGGTLSTVQPVANCGRPFGEGWDSETRVRPAAYLTRP